ncbi:MAG: DUF6814 family protein [Bacteroidota bacterium]
MNAAKKYFGWIWMALGPLIIGGLLYGAYRFIDPLGKKDINNPVVWTIIIGIFTPIAIGLMLFGWYAWKGEYDRIPHSSTELE